MIAYNTNWLDNLEVQQQLEEAAAMNCITKEEKEMTSAKYNVGFYTPNLFIRIGLFILTVVIASFSLGLLSLNLLSGGGEKSFAVILFVLALAAYFALEVMVRGKNHYQSGADDALIWITGACIIGGINMLGDLSPAVNAGITLLIATYFLVRFIHPFMGILVVSALLAFILLSLGNAGNFAKAILPFLLFIISAVIYFLAQNLSKKTTFRLYKDAFTFIKITALLSIYISVNYYVVREASINMFQLELEKSDKLPFGWIFWFFTIFIPIAYIYWGIKKKDILFLRVGLLLVAAIVFTVRYYYAVMPMEIAMTIGGAILIAGAYFLIQYLRQPRNGFTSNPIADKQMQGKLNIEALVIAETFSGATPANENNFGGGSLGGGGASGDF